MDTRPQMATIAQSAAWNNTVVVDRILAHLPAQDHVKAQRINKVFFDSANRPSMWMRRFGAAELNFETRRICLREPLIRRLPDGTFTSAPLRVGTYQKEPWYVQEGTGDRFFLENLDVGRLDSLKDWEKEIGAVFMAILPPPANEEELEARRQEKDSRRRHTYAFLLDRGYRRAHGIHKLDIVHPAVACFWGAALATAACGYGAHRFVVDATEWRHSVQNCLLMTPAVFVGVILGLGCVMTFFMPVVESVRGPARYCILNRAADEFYRLQIATSSSEAVGLLRSTTEPSAG